MSRPSLKPIEVEGLALNLNGSQKIALATVARALLKVNARCLSQLPADLTVFAGVGPETADFIREFVAKAPAWYVETLLGITVDRDGGTDAVQKLPAN